MRRALLIVALGGVLVTGAACGTDTTPSALPTPSAPATGSTGPDYSEDTKKVCTAIGEVLSKNLGAFGSELGNMIANKEAEVSAGATDAEKKARKNLRTFAAELRKATAESTNPQLRAAGEQAADKLLATAKDDEFYDKIKSSKDLDKALGPTTTEWLSPIAGHCA